MTDAIRYAISPPVSDDQLNALFATAWDDHQPADFQRALAHSLAWVCAWDGERLVGFVKLIWDGGNHAFLLDTTVHRDVQHRGIGTRLVTEALAVARQHGVEWVHVDYEPHLHGFYTACGFRPTQAGLVNLREDATE